LLKGYGAACVCGMRRGCCAAQVGVPATPRYGHALVALPGTAVYFGKSPM
jgi:hypothetical protein